MTVPSLVVQDVHVQFKESVILDRMSLEFADGQFVSIIGTSGCGKTTLLRAIGGLLPEAKGQILLHGKPLNAPDPRVAMVFQHFGLFPWKTVEQNVSYGLDVQGREDRDGNIDRLLGIMKLNDARKKYPHQLSGGMKQRVGIARALCMEPELMLLDEPLSAVDAITRETMQYEVLGLWERQTAMNALLVTHDLDEAIIMSDRIVVLTGPPARIVLDVQVPIERPRQLAGIRSHPAYLPLRNQLWDSLQGPSEKRAPSGTREDSAA